jgi:hypothetical protein
MDSEIFERLEEIGRQNRKVREGAVLGLLFLAFLVFMGLSGCSSEQPKQTSVAAPVPASVLPYQRFVPVQGGLDWALDTKTGQLCRTWDWSTAAVRNAKETEKPWEKYGLQGSDAAASLTRTCAQLADSELTTLPDGFVPSKNAVAIFGTLNGKHGYVRNGKFNEVINWDDLKKRPKGDPLGLYSK